MTVSPWRDVAEALRAVRGPPEGGRWSSTAADEHQEGVAAGHALLMFPHS
ncbi:hypothetical protein [Streptomyces sp. NPDC001999]